MINSVSYNSRVLRWVGKVDGDTDAFALQVRTVGLLTLTVTLILTLTLTLTPTLTPTLTLTLTLTLTPLLCTAHDPEEPRRVLLRGCIPRRDTGERQLEQLNEGGKTRYERDSLNPHA